MSSSLKHWEERKAFVNFTDEDAVLLKELRVHLEDRLDDVVDQLYANWTKYEDLQRLLFDTAIVERLKATQKEYFLRMLSGEYGDDYHDDRLRVGTRHQSIGLDVRWYMGGFCNYVQIVTPMVFEALKPDYEKAEKMLMALYKLINLDEELAISTYIQAREEVIESQHAEILEISTPVVQLWDGVVAAPIIGTMDSVRTQQFMERLLETIVETKSPVALVDITGVSAIDTATAQHLIDTIHAVRLLGAQVIITGVSPPIAQTLVHLGINLSDISTCASLADGLKLALKQIGKEI